ncbi:MAG: class I SAM-dependent RNA methyltransferase, partial [Nocardioides sp.]
MVRSPRRRQTRGRSRVGERYSAVVGPIAHGGHCIARLPADAGPVRGGLTGPGQRVVFIRHAL